LVSCTRSKRC